MISLLVRPLIKGGAQWAVAERGHMAIKPWDETVEGLQPFAGRAHGVACLPDR